MHRDDNIPSAREPGILPNVFLDVVAIACFAVSTGAHAPDPGKIVRFPAIAPAELPADVRQKIDQTIDGALAEAGYTVVTAKSCADEACRKEALEQAGAAAGVEVTVGAFGSDYRISVKLVDGEGAISSTKEEACEICRHEEVVAKVGTLVTAASADAPPPAAAEEVEPESAAPTLLSIKSDPKGGTVIVDGRAVGTTPVLTEVEPGPHVVRIERKGYEPSERTIETVAGETSLESFDLTRVRMMKPETEILIGWVALGVGVAAVAAGAALVAIDENPIKSDCGGANVDANGVCKYRYNTLGGGVAMMVVGLAATGAGIGFVVHGYKGRGRQREVAFGASSVTWRF